MGSPGMVLGLLVQFWDDPTQNRNPTPSFPGLLFVLLGAGSVGVAIMLGAWFRGRRCCQQKDSGNSPPCPSPRPGHPISMVRVFPSPGPTQQPRPRGFPKVGEE
uniref:Uncharacterized protein n=1 Tax=Mandrillus leucophaeus TaxID=9568 RepID=A0A2K5XIT8_MANLE